jgi:hypothetical protein
MATLIDISNDEWAGNKPKTPAHNFMKTYLQMLDNADWITQNSLRFYGPSCLFHNQNGIDLEGSQNLWRFLPRIFEPVTKMWHEVLNCKEVRRAGDPIICLELQLTRHLWLKGQPFDEHNPTVSAPLHGTVYLMPSVSPEGDLGYQMKEIFIYWDKALLAPYVESKATMFETLSGWNEATSAPLPA